MTLFRFFLSGLIGLCVLTLLLHTYLLPKDFGAAFSQLQEDPKSFNEVVYNGKVVSKRWPAVGHIKSADTANQLLEDEEDKLGKELVDQVVKHFSSNSIGKSINAQTTVVSGLVKPAEQKLSDDQLGRVRDAAELHQRSEGYRQHAFNVLVSDRIGFHRRLPDTRNSACAHAKYSSHLVRVSVIICFYNEAFSTLLRTVYSILNRTNGSLLEEILLIDDFSTSRFPCCLE